MRITTIRSEGLAALSYFVSSANEAMVIDPRRDAKIYESLAVESDTKITHIFETHRNEDYVTGSLEVKSYYPDAKIGHSKATKFGFGDINIDDGETYQIGKMRVTCYNTPGHTDDSMCYVVTDTTSGNDSIVAFTGDTLFVNEVGRTDLVDITKHALMSNKLYKSLHEKVLTLGDGVIIHPGHGAGSVCGGDIGDREFSTIGYEKKHNRWLSMDEDEFVKSKINQQLTRASYFKRCEKLNTDGPPLLSSLKPLEEFEVDEYEKLIDQPDHRAIDTRRKYDFLVGHIPKSISMGLKNIGLIAGWALRPKQTFSFVLPNESDLARASCAMFRVGLDNVIGYLKDGYDNWVRSGKAISSIPSIAVEDLHSRQIANEITIVDVRESHEYQQERIANSLTSPLTRLEEELQYLDTEDIIATVCPSGFRSTTAASIMKHYGIDNVAVLLEGFEEWKEKGYPMEE